ncbi:hypothetical protein AB0D91_05780 [Streptomyces canus]
MVHLGQQGDGLPSSLDERAFEAPDTLVSNFIDGIKSLRARET